MGCVSCGGYSYDPKRGLSRSCVTESYEMQLPISCVPADVVGDVAVCNDKYVIQIK